MGNLDKSDFWLLSKNILSIEQIQQLLNIAKQYDLKDKVLIFNKFDIDSKDKFYDLMKTKKE